MRSVNKLPNIDSGNVDLMEFTLKLRDIIRTIVSLSDIETVLSFQIIF